MERIEETSGEVIRKDAMKETNATTYWLKIYQSGSIETAKEVIRREAFPGGLCVTIEPTDYIYLGGEEAGFVIGLVNYPRFPEEPEKIFERAKSLALKILDETWQISTMIMTPTETILYQKEKAR
jgi:hypothetical protein